MPRTRSLAWIELKVGLVAVFALVMAGALILMLSSSGGLFWQRYTINTAFTDVAGLSSGSPVRLAGVEVGSVSLVSFAGDRVQVVMDINREMQSRITTDSVASLGSVSLLGEAAVDISAATTGTAIQDGGFVESAENPLSLTSVASQATESLEAAGALLGAVQSGEGTIGRLFTDGTLYQELSGFVLAAEAVIRQVGEGQGTIGRLMEDSTAATSLENALEDLGIVMSRIRSGEGNLGRLLADDSLGSSLASTTENLADITERLRRGEGTAGRLMTETALYDRLDSLAERFEGVTASLEAGDGTAGLLLHDRALYENMNEAVSEVRSLAQDIRADPRRFLNVRVSLF